MRVLTSSADPSADLDAHVAVWIYHLDATADGVHALAETLDAVERDRARRFVFERDRMRFIVGRGTVRRVLASHLECAPEELKFTYGEEGKPALAAIDAKRSLSFNVSHADGLIAIAVGGHLHPVGVDIERLRHVEDALQIARRNFRASEYEVLQNASVDSRSELFLRLWTRKEALHKADGRGLRLPLDTFEVTAFSLEDSHPVCDAKSTRWWLHALKLPTGFIGALAYSGERCTVDLHFGDLNFPKLIAASR